MPVINQGLKITMVSLGCLSVGLGVVGIFLPLVPTTPFLLLSAWLFARSSDRFHSWLLNHPRLGPMVSAWQDGRGLERSVRRRILITMWLTMLVSALIVQRIWVAALLLIIAACVTIYLMKRPVFED